MNFLSKIIAFTFVLLIVSGFIFSNNFAFAISYSVSGILSPDATTENTGEPAGTYNGQDYWTWTGYDYRGEEPELLTFYLFFSTFFSNWYISHELGNTAGWSRSPNSSEIPGNYTSTYWLIEGIATVAEVVSSSSRPPRIIKYYSLSITPNILEGGEISNTENIYSENSIISVNATPNNGYRFLYYKEDNTILSEKPIYSFLIDKDKDIIVYFEKIDNTDNNTDSIADNNKVEEETNNSSLSLEERIRQLKLQLIELLSQLLEQLESRA